MARAKAGGASQQGSKWKTLITELTHEDPEQLLAHPYNWRIHAAHQQRAMQAVLEEVGWAGAVIVNDTTGHVLDGHMRVQLAISNREKSIPVLHLTASEEQERLILATYDPIGALAVADREQMAALLTGISTEDATLRAMLETLKPVTTLTPDGDENGQLPEERLGIYEANTIRQVVLHYANDEFTEINELLERLRDEYDEDNNATAILRLLREHFDDEDD